MGRIMQNIVYKVNFRSIWAVAVLALSALPVGYAVSLAAEPEAAAQVERRQALRQAYAVLETRRQALRRETARLRHEFWGLKLPTALAKTYRERMQAALYALQNPRQLGGFRDVGAVHKAVSHIDYLHQQLLAVEQAMQRRE